MSEALAQTEYVPDPRNEPGYWTIQRVLDEQRPPLAREGWGGTRRLWACCDGCGAERTLDLEHLAKCGFGNKLIGELPLRCKCGAEGHAVLRWVNEPIVRVRKWSHLPVPGKPRPGSFNLATGEKRGGWD